MNRAEKLSLSSTAIIPESQQIEKRDGLL
jgi:hypothetical protein